MASGLTKEEALAVGQANNYDAPPPVAMSFDFVTQDPKARKKAVTTLERHFKKFKPNYFRQTY